jgi:hypothetical protein
MKLCTDLEARYPYYCETTMHDPMIRMTSRATGSVLAVEAYPEKRGDPNSPLRIYKINLSRLPSLPRRVYVYHYSSILRTGVTDIPVPLPNFITRTDGMDVKARRTEKDACRFKGEPRASRGLQETA